MTVYKGRPGVVLTEIAGEYVLVAAKALKGECPYVMQLNETSAFLWRQLGSGMSLEQLGEAVAEEYEIDDPAAAREAIVDFIRQMVDLHYLVTEELPS
ncbi:MAG: PqqD family protein [Oscillospiraceae bacterium]|nr:PqqD family protein [Oscillospiraceae bacterium]